MNKWILRLLLATALAMALSVSVPGIEARADDDTVGPRDVRANLNIRPVVGAKHYQLIVDKATQLVTALRQDENGDYTVIERQMVCSTGVPPRTSPGTFKIGMKRRWLNSPPKNGRPQSYEQFAVCFNKPIWFHATVCKKMDPHTLETDSYLNLGSPVSAGCVRLSVRDALWVYANCPAGTVVKVVKDGGPAPACVLPLPALEEGMDYDPTDPTVQTR